MIQLLIITSVLISSSSKVQSVSSNRISHLDWLNDVDGDNIPGRAGIDYPVHATVPQGTRFRCKDYDYAGYFGDVESDCQAYHVCFPDGRNASFLCVNGTVFHQRYFVCDWWFHFNCSHAINLYDLNLFRKVPLPVLPPVRRRVFPGPAPQPGPAPAPGPAPPSRPGPFTSREPPSTRGPKNIPFNGASKDKSKDKSSTDKNKGRGPPSSNTTPRPPTAFDFSKNKKKDVNECDCRCDQVSGSNKYIAPNLERIL